MEKIREKLLLVLKSKGEILPSASSPRGKLWQLVNSPDSSLSECAEVIELDSALASRLFRVANSGAYGIQASNITEAILHLGIKFVREQVFNAGVFKEYAGWKLPAEWDSFWLRNIFVARVCERMTAAYEFTNGSEYLACLIHDMGWLFLASYFPNEYLQIFACGKPILEAEKEFLPFGHAEISAALASRSLLPLRAVNAILYHQAPLVVKSGEPTELFKNANLLSVVMNVSDKLADVCHMDMFGRSELTVDGLEKSPEVIWLNQYGKLNDFYAIAEEELAKAKEIFSVYFADRSFE
jgi:HD-like signal output (HDOD) protein